MPIDVIRKCRLCGKFHPVFYHYYSNGTKHLKMICPKGNIHFHIPLEDNLDIISISSKKDFKKEENQPKLF